MQLHINVENQTIHKALHNKVIYRKLNLFQKICIFIRPSFLFISWRWEWKAARHCTRSRKRQEWEPSTNSRASPLVSGSAVPVQEQTRNKFLVHAPCPCTHFQLGINPWPSSEIPKSPDPALVVILLPLLAN